MTPSAIVLHHSLTKDHQTVSWGAIRRYHMSYKCEGYAIAPEHVYEMARNGAPVEKPWSDIGYHYGIELIGDYYEVLAGRMMTEAGAHCTQLHMNHISLGVCFVGNFDETPPPVDQWQAGLKLVSALMTIFNIGVGKVYGHRDLASYKSCPGAKFDLKQFREELMAAGA